MTTKIVRDPSIHITESRLTSILEDLLNGEGYGIDYGTLAKSIISAARLHPLNSRKLLVDKKKTHLKYTKLLSSGKDRVAVFQKHLILCRTELRHRGITRITENHRDWAKLKEVVALVEVFAKDFNLPFNKACRDFIRIGLVRMNKYILHKFVPLYESISESYASVIEIRESGLEKDVNKLFEYFREVAIQKAGVCADYSRIPDKLIYFLRVLDYCSSSGIPPKKYIYAQFEGLRNIQLVPDPAQLVGVNAVKRYTDFLANDVQGVAPVKIDFSKVKKGK